ncbi:MAG: hypothetical protein HZB65_04780 [Candidatus Aenigmarchaeota archaeon]|nr:hypothetical protein [Candidatus Aenigmarchaeota archaeon]
MSLLENLGKSIGSMILIISIVGLVFAYGFAQATDYDSLKPVFTDLTASQLKSVSDSEQLRSLINQQCLSTDTITMPIGNTMLELDCKELQSAEDIEKYASGKIFDSFYYKEYDCSAIECLQNALGPEKQNLGVLVSDKMHSLLETMMIYLIADISMLLYLQQA